LQFSAEVTASYRSRVIAMRLSLRSIDITALIPLLERICRAKRSSSGRSSLAPSASSLPKCRTTHCTILSAYSSPFQQPSSAFHAAQPLSAQYRMYRPQCSAMSSAKSSSLKSLSAQGSYPLGIRAIA